MKSVLNTIKTSRPFRIARVAHHRTEGHIKVGLPIFAMIILMSASLIYKLSTVTHVNFAY